MATTIFLVLSGLAVVFLFYVLANFWNEGQRPLNIARKFAAEFGKRDWAEVLVVTRPISHIGRDGLSVIPFRPQDRGFGNRPAGRVASSAPTPVRAERISTR